MSVNKKMRDEIVEMIDYILEKDSYLRGKLKDKKVVGMNVNDIDEDMKNVKNDSVKKMLKLMKGSIMNERGSELVKNYGGLILNKRIVDKVLNRKRK